MENRKVLGIPCVIVRPPLLFSGSLVSVAILDYFMEWIFDLVASVKMLTHQKNCDLVAHSIFYPFFSPDIASL